MKSRCRRPTGLRRTTRWGFSSQPSAFSFQKTLGQLPDHVNWIAREPGIGGDDWPALFDTLRDEQAVERVAMVERQGFDSQDVVQADRQQSNTVGAEFA